MADFTRQQRLERLISCVEPTVIDVYRNEKIPAVLVMVDPEHYAASNATKWIQYEQFRDWYTEYVQRASTSGNAAPQLPSVTTTQSAPKTSSDLPDLQHSSATIKVETSATLPEKSAPRKPAPPKKKRRRSVSPTPTSSIDTSGIIDLCGSDDEVTIVEPSAVTTRKKSKKAKTSRVKITRQADCSKLIRRVTLPDVWPIPKPDEDDYAWLVDLTDSTVEYPPDAQGNKASMISRIRDKDQDSWDGSGGYTKAGKTSASYIEELGESLQVASLKCQSVWICSFFDPALLANLTRYDVDLDQRRALWDAQREQNSSQADSSASAAALFYEDCQTKPCPLVRSDGTRCPGKSVIRPLSSTNYDGKNYFVGCENWSSDHDRGHRFITIKRNINEDLLRELYMNDGQFQPETLAKHQARLPGKTCSYLVTCKHHRGNAECPYLHVDTNGNIVKGKLVRPLQKCQAEMKIFAPVDRDISKAVVKLTHAHNHPIPPYEKLTQEVRAQYEQCVAEMGVVGATVLKVDSARTTANLLGSTNPADFSAALAIRRNKEKVIRETKNKIQAHGNGIEGVFAQKLKDAETLSVNEQYIHEIRISPKHAPEIGSVVVTAFRELLGLVHNAPTSLHDNTYKRIKGDEWKEWEVVIWNRRLDRRATISRIYMTRETRATFKLVWRLYFDAIESLTGRPVRFRFLHGHGQGSILLDGSHPQIMGNGDVLLEENLKIPAENRLVHYTKAEDIVQHVCRICLVHNDRNYDSLAPHITLDEMKAIRSVRFVQSHEEVEELYHRFEGSSNSRLAGWINDKKGKPYYPALVNEHLTKMDSEDWYLSPSDTNLNESAHPHANERTGIGLSLLDAIQSARKVDWEELCTLQRAEKDNVHPNPRNTDRHRLHRNQLRNEAHIRHTQTLQSNINTLNQMDADLNAARAQHKAAVADVKELEAARKDMALPRGARCDLDDDIVAAREKRSQAYTQLQDLQRKKAGLDIHVSPGFRRKVNQGETLRGKSTLADPAYADLHDPPSSPSRPANSQHVLDDDHDFAFQELTNTLPDSDTAAPVDDAPEGFSNSTPFDAANFDVSWIDRLPPDIDLEAGFKMLFPPPDLPPEDFSNSTPFDAANFDVSWIDRLPPDIDLEAGFKMLFPPP